jgi:hypothetical protein
MTSTARGVMLKRVERLAEYLPTDDDHGGHDKSQPEQGRDACPRSLFAVMTQWES